jgi:site-specific recombinase XerD
MAWIRWSASNARMSSSYIRSLGEAGLMASSTNTMMHGVRGYFRFAHIGGLIHADLPSTPDYRRFTATSPAPKDWTDSS